MKKTAENLNTQAVNLIHFHGLSLLVARHNQIDYVPARPLIGLAGIQWKKARERLLSADNSALFGTKELNTPGINQEMGGDGQILGNGLPKKQVYIRLDRARMYLARINTKLMRLKGNETAADKLLALQIEWANVLHKYETGETVSKNQNNERTLINLINARKNCLGNAEKQALSVLIKREIGFLGADMKTEDDKQMNLLSED